MQGQCRAVEATRKRVVDFFETVQKTNRLGPLVVLGSVHFVSWNEVVVTVLGAICSNSAKANRLSFQHAKVSMITTENHRTKSRAADSKSVAFVCSPSQQSVPVKTRTTNYPSRSNRSRHILHCTQAKTQQSTETRNLLSLSVLIHDSAKLFPSFVGSIAFKRPG
jgi:hypothetical protein